MTTEATFTKPQKDRIKPYVKDSKFKVRPNLSLRGIDIQNRLKSNTLDTQHNSQYSLDEKIDETRRMSKLDIHTKYNENQRKIQDLNDKLNKANTPKK